MQITESAAIDWARAEKIQTFVSSDLFDPKVNIEAGTWYLNRALNTGLRRITLCRSLWRSIMPAARAFGAGCKIPAWERPPERETFRQRWISR